MSATDRQQDIPPGRAGSATPSAPAGGFAAFVVVWAGQFASLIGSDVTGFALGIHVYRLTDSATTFGIILALGLLPAVIASPFAGPLVDRWGSRRALLVSNVGNALVTTTLAVLLITDTFEVWHVYPLVIVTSAIGALEIPAFASLAPRLVPPRHLGRANGMRMFALAASQVLAPALAGVLLLTIGIGGVVAVDLVTFLVAIATLLAVRVPHDHATSTPPGRAPEDGPASPGRPSSLLGEFAQGCRYVGARRGLLHLLVFLAAVNLSVGFMELLITPLVLAFASAAALGAVMSAGGAGMLLASLLISVWGVPRRRVMGVIAFCLGMGVITAAGSARPSVVLVAAAAFVFMGFTAAFVSTTQTLWQSKVDPSLLGRVMALVHMVSLVPQLVANVTAGIAVDRVFEPLVGREEVRSPALAALVGEGPGRGAALLMMLVGAFLVVSALVAVASPRLRRLQEELPDTLETPGGASDPPTVDTERAGAAARTGAPVPPGLTPP